MLKRIPSERDNERQVFTISIGTERTEQLIREHADMIYRIALHNVSNPSDAEDIMQDVALALLTKCPDDLDEIAVKHWLIRVTINKCRSFHRQFWQRKRESIDDHLELEAPGEDRGVMEEVMELPKKERNIIYLFYYEQYSIKEIAEILRMNANTVSSHLQRARKKLKQILTEGGTYHE